MLSAMMKTILVLNVIMLIVMLLIAMMLSVIMLIHVGLIVIILNVIILISMALSDIMLIAIVLHADWYGAECHCAGFYYAERRCADCGGIEVYHWFKDNFNTGQLALVTS
jgi:hypothetical protein